MKEHYKYVEQGDSHLPHTHMHHDEMVKKHAAGHKHHSEFHKEHAAGHMHHSEHVKKMCMGGKTR